MKTQILLGYLCLCALSSFTLLAKRKIMADKATSTVTYDMKHPLHKWQAVSREVNCAMIYNDEAKQPENVAVSMKVASFDSGNSNRDSHALEVLDALKFPSVTFVSESIQPGANGALAIKGNLTFHGVTKPITLQATRQETANRINITGNFDVNMTDYKVEPPSLMGLKTEDQIKMTFDVAFKL